MDSESFRKLLPVVDGFPKPDWEGIYTLLDPLPENDPDGVWVEFARTWVNVMAECVGPTYTVSETDEFLILSSMESKKLKLFETFVEETRRSVLRKLSDIAEDEGEGKHVLFLFADTDTYDRYISHTYPSLEEEPDFDRFLDDWVLTPDDDIQGFQPRAFSTGYFCNEPYGHIAFSHADLSGTQAVFTRELTKAFLRQSPMPLWLKLALAQTLENEVCNSSPLHMDVSSIANHQQFWDADTIQEFWSGESFHRPDAGGELSYELGRYCLQALSHDLDEFKAFANEASFEDGGEAAALKVFGGSLGGLPFQFFGEGDWSP
ncbi:MAG: hypothetical protein AB8G18_06525, partial [Gammaproteobacteria bacterium]